MKTVEDLFPNLIGQEQAKLAITDWVNFETQPLLVYGSSGYGKTAFAESLKCKTVDTTQMRGDRLNTILKPIKEAEDGDILFFDEIHSLPGKVLEGLYKIIDTNSFYDPELCMDLALPNVRFIFATNILDKLPIAFQNRCRFIELQEYTEEELILIINKNVPELNVDAIKPIVRASKGVPRTALSLAKSIVAGAKTEKYENIQEAEVNSLLESRMSIDPTTGLSSKEFKIVQKVIERGHLSTAAVANLLKTTKKDAVSHYIDPLRASEWIRSK